MFENNTINSQPKIGNEPQLDTKTDYYNLPLASFTFGRDGDKKLFQFTQKQDKDEQKIIKEEKENGKESDILYSIPMNIENRKISPHKTKIIYSTFINKIGNHNSFLSVILHSIYHMKKLRNFILNELSELKEKDNKSKLLYYIRNILIKYPESKKIELTQLRSCLAELFQNRRKFLIDHPDDPCDCYFAIINAIHSFYMQYNPNEITDESCREKCFAHKCLWLDLLRIDECECRGSTKRLFSNFNYVFDVPMEQIFDLMKTTVIIPSDPLTGGNNIRIKERHISQIPYAMNEFQGKLFSYYKVLFNQAKINCPVNGSRCNINCTHKRLVINNNPLYMVFSLQQQYKNNNFLSISVMDILRSFVLIPHSFEIGQLFEISQMSKNGYTNVNGCNIFKFYGCVMMRNSRVYTCVFKKHSIWLYFDDENLITLSSWFDVIAFSLKSGDIPIMIFYSADERPNGIDTLSQEEILLLERYSINAENIGKSFGNKLRINEEVLPLQEKVKARTISNENNNKNVSLPIRGGNNNIVNGNTITPNLNINTNINPTNVNSNYSEYMCYNCYFKNKIENKSCVKCGANNMDIINDILNIRQSDNMNLHYMQPLQVPAPSSVKNSMLNQYPVNIIQNSKPNMISSSSNYNSGGSANKNQLINPFKVEKKRANPIVDDENDNIHQKRYFDMPRQFNPKKEAPIIIKTQNHSLSSQKPINLISNPPHSGAKSSSLNKSEDRIVPTTDSRPRTGKKPSSSTHNNLNISPDTWACPNCNNFNKDYDMKCRSKLYKLIKYRLQVQ